METGVATDTPPSRLAWNWTGMWTLVFIANLPVVLWFAIGVAQPNGYLGLVGALAVMFWLGFALCLFRFRVGRSLVWGGAVFALTQFIPVLHFFCGMVGLVTWMAIGGEPLVKDYGDFSETEKWWGNQNLGVFIALLLAAHPMLLLSLLFGTIVRWYRGDRPIWFTRRTDSDPDAEPEQATEPSDEPPHLSPPGRGRRSERSEPGG